MAVTQTSAGSGAARALVAFVLLWAPAAGAGELHRWVDEGGDVHYTDAPPPESARSAGPDEAEDKEDADARARQEAAEAERAERSRRDRILWESYSSVADIERTRDRRLEAVDGEIGLAEHRVERVRDQIERYDRLLADLPEDNEHRAEMERQRADARERLERRVGELERIQARRMRMEARFAREIERFRELTADRE
ncbi:MAG: DUF4124 domain-containing protein [Halofilum sp. (in: g-proteobacteria)]|nr:DUF4124 domain-containing protein [Halofilum sp. (in: g-proteobacteria)]